MIDVSQHAHQYQACIGMQDPLFYVSFDRILRWFDRVELIDVSLSAVVSDESMRRSNASLRTALKSL
jgi:hypothetical protein